MVLTKPPNPIERPIRKPGMHFGPNGCFHKLGCLYAGVSILFFETSIFVVNRKDMDP